VGQAGEELRVSSADGGFGSSRGGASAGWNPVGLTVAEGHHTNGDPGLLEACDGTLKGLFRRLPGLFSVAEEEQDRGGIAIRLGRYLGQAPTQARARGANLPGCHGPEGFLEEGSVLTGGLHGDGVTAEQV
jgi:hypothetical protein